jgi:hypothetical protein
MAAAAITDFEQISQESPPCNPGRASFYVDDASLALLGTRHFLHHNSPSPFVLHIVTRETLAQGAAVKWAPSLPA